MKTCDLVEYSHGEFLYRLVIESVDGCVVTASNAERVVVAHESCFKLLNTGSGENVPGKEMGSKRRKKSKTPTRKTDRRVK